MGQIQLTDAQRNALNKLWFVYGNHGKKCTKGNHSYIQGFLEYGEDRKMFYVDGIKHMRDKGYPEEKIKEMAITQECIDAVETILNSNTL